MIVGYGDNNTLLIGIIQGDVETLQRDLTLTYEGTKMLVKDIVIVYGVDKEHLIMLLKSAGVSVTEETLEKYRRGERTDHPRRNH